MNFGLCTAGLEEAIEKYLKLVCERFFSVNYFEIGVAYGGTITSSSKILSDNCKDWFSVGLDLPIWAFGGKFDGSWVMRNADRYKLPIQILKENSTIMDRKQIVIFLVPSSDFFLNPIHYAFIDGCHCKACVKADFLRIEPCVPVGGIVAFHDFNEGSIVGQPQSYLNHGGEAVVEACTELGLLDGREGWRYLDKVIANPNAPKGEIGPGRNMGVFERI